MGERVFDALERPGEQDNVDGATRCRVSRREIELQDVLEIPSSQFDIVALLDDGPLQAFDPL